jgi:hypothetical protein
MRFGRGLCWCVAVSLVGSVSYAGDPSASEASDRAVALVRKLGDPSVRARDKASQELVKLGRAATQALLAGSRDSDPEVRTRCRHLLPAALWLDLQARISAYLADTSGSQGHDLPGLARYQQLLGSSPEARALFGEIIKSDPLLLEQAESDPKAAVARFTARAQLLQQQQFNNIGSGRRPAANKSDVACMLFIGTSPDLDLPTMASYPLYTLLQQEPVRSAITSAGPDDPLRKLLLAWIKRRTDPTSVQQSLSLAMNLDLKECLDLAVTTLRDKQCQAWNRAAAATTVGKLGGRGALPVLESVLTDSTQVANMVLNNARGTTELRDVALALCVHLTGQKLADYHFEVLGNNPGMLFTTYHYSGFSDPTQREAAFKKWKTWRLIRAGTAFPLAG